MENKIDKPHDHFFRATFSKKLVAQAYIEHFLPKAINSKIDLDSLELENGSYVDEQLTENITDLIYSCRLKDLKEKIEISFLWEHKSFIPKYPHIQLLRYLLNAWEQQYYDSKKLKITIPIIVYHGKGKWRYKSFEEYFPIKDKHFSQFIPKFEYLLTDLSQLEDQRLNTIKMGFLGAALLLMKHNKDGDYIKNQTTDIFLYARKETPEHLFETFIRIAVVYISNASPIEYKDIQHIANNLPPKLDTMVKTAYEQFVEMGEKKGEKKGFKKGIEVNKLFTTLQLFKNFPRIKNDKVALITNLSILEITKIKKQYPVTNKKKHKATIKKLLIDFPNYDNQEIALLFGISLEDLLILKKSIQKEDSSK